MIWEADQEEQLPAQVSKPGRRRARRRGASPCGPDVRDLHGNLQGGRGASSAPVSPSLPRKVSISINSARGVRVLSVLSTRRYQGYPAQPLMSVDSSVCADSSNPRERQAL